MYVNKYINLLGDDYEIIQLASICYSISISIEFYIIRRQSSVFFNLFFFSFLFWLSKSEWDFSRLKDTDREVNFVSVFPINNVRTY